MPNSRDFQADSIQVGNLRRALSETVVGDLVLRDEFFPEGIRLRDLDSFQQTYSLVYDVSSGLQIQIDANTAAIIAISAESMAKASLQTAYENGNTISGSVNLEFDVPVTIVQNDLYVGDQFITNLTAAEGNLLTVDNQGKVIDTNFPVDEVVDKTLLAAISGDLEDQIQQNSTTITSPSGTITVNQAGADAEIDVKDYISKTEVANISSGLSEVIGNVFGGSISLVALQTQYVVSDARLTPTSNPVCTIDAPSIESTIPSLVVYGISNGSFNVELSISPPISGYHLNWMTFAVPV